MYDLEILQCLQRIDESIAALRNIFVPANDPRRPPQPFPTPVPIPLPVTPAPTPEPAPPPPTPAPVPAGMQEMHIGGTNNFVFGHDGTAVSFPLPTTWPDGTPVESARVQFATTPGRNFGVETYEICFSPTPGDFEYYKTDAASQTMGGQKFYPGGAVSGPDVTLNWGKSGNIWTCQIDDRQWYMNWRVHNCPPGETCGQTFFVPKG